LILAKCGAHWAHAARRQLTMAYALLVSEAAGRSAVMLLLMCETAMEAMCMSGCANLCCIS
jgi:hypothetical protein